MDEIEAHRRTDADAAEGQGGRPRPPTSPRAATSSASATRSARRSTPSPAMPSCWSAIPAPWTADAVRVIRRSADAPGRPGRRAAGHLAHRERLAAASTRDRVNLVELLDQIVDMFRLQAAAKGIVFQHDRPGNLPAYVYTDEKRLRQILINLLSNAIKYTPAGRRRADRALARARWRSSRSPTPASASPGRRSRADLRAVRADRRGAEARPASGSA